MQIVCRLNGGLRCLVRFTFLALLFLIATTLRVDAVGTFIPATNRVDMVHDSTRDIIYISNGSQIVRYHVGSNVLLSPFQLTGTLRGIDISPDNNWLVVADQLYSTTNTWVHVVDLRTGTSSRAFFARAFSEAGTSLVTFGGDGSALIDSGYEGSGSVPLRRYDPVTGSVVQVSTINQSSYMAASGDGAVIGIAEGNSSGGPLKRYSVPLKTITLSAQSGNYNDEIGVNKDGSQFALSTYFGTTIYDGAFSFMTNIGVYAGARPIGIVYHPTADAVFFSWATSTEVRAYNTMTWAELGRFDFQESFGSGASGRLRISRDGAIVLATVTGGVRFYQHTLSVPQYRRFTISGNPIAVGNPTPHAHGTNWLPLGITVTNKVVSSIETNLSRLRCDGWLGTGSVPAAGSTNVVTFTLNDHSTLTWNWSYTHYQLLATISGQGSVNMTNAWFPVGSNAVLTANPSPGHRFVRWLGDLPTSQSTNATISLPMTQGRQVMAVFTTQGGVGTYLAGEWPTFGQNVAHTGYFPGILGEGLFRPRWTSTNGGYTAVAGGKVFTSRGTRLNALSEHSGEPVWRYEFPFGRLNPPTYDSATIYVQSSSEAKLWSIDAITGRTNWSTPFSQQSEDYYAPVVADGRIFVNGGTYGGMYGYNQATGTQLFFTGLEQYDEWTPAYYNGKLFSYVAGNLREHDKVGGAVLRTANLGWSWSGWSMNRTISMANNHAYLVNTNLMAVSLETFQPTWKVNGAFSGTPATARGVVYALSNSVVSAYSALNGSLVGVYVADAYLLTQPIVTDDVLIVSSTSKTYVFDLYDFTLKQTLPTGGSLSLANGVLYVSSNNVLRAYSANEDTTLVVSGNPVSVGVPSPAYYGTNWFVKGSSVTTGVPTPVEVSGTRYRCLGWTGSGDVPTAGQTNSVVFTLNNNSALTWNWEAYQYLLEAVAAGPGTTSITNGWYAANSVVAVSAIPKPGYQFVRWNGDVPTADVLSNPLTLTMDRTRRVTAVFATTNTARVNGEWPMFGRNAAHTGYVPGVLGQQSFGPRWSTVIGGSLNPVATGDNRIYASSSGFVTAIHEYTGQSMWWYTMPSGHSVNPPSFSNGSIFVQRGNHGGDTHLWKFDASNGTVTWKSPHSAQWERYMAPTIADGNVWINGGYYGGMYGFDEASGVQKFFVGLSQYDGWTPAYYQQKIYSYVGGQFQEHDRNTGASQWALSIGRESYGSYGVTRTLVMGEGLGFFCAGTNLTAVDLNNRQIAWRALGSYASFPTVANGVVYAIIGTNVHAFNMLGQRTATYAADTSLAWQPIVTDDALIVASASKTYVFDLSTAALRQTIPLGGNISLANGVLYFPSAGTLHAYSLGTDTRLTVQSSSGNHGNPFPFIYGTNLVASGSLISPSVQTPFSGGTGTRYLSTGWTGSGSVPASGSGNIASFVITNESVITWNWKTQYFLNTEVVSTGTVSVADSWFDAGSVVTVTATPSNYFHFVNWAGDATGTSAVIQVSMSAPRLVVANFAPNMATNNTPTWWLAQNGISPDDAGALADADGDGLANWQEFIYGTNPNVPDSDSDSYADGFEVSWGSIPTNAQSIPKATLVIQGSPTTNGTPLPLGYGTNFIALLRDVTNSVPAVITPTNGVRNVLLGWTGSGSVPSSGSSNSVSFFFATNSTLTWNWQKQHLLTLSNVLGGSISAVAEIRDTNGNVVSTEISTNGWWNDGTVVTLTAVSSNYYHFVNWSGAVTESSNPVLVAMSAARSVGAIFAPDLVTNNVPKWWLAQHGLPVSDDGAMQDTDSDGLVNWQEYIYNSNPNVVDTDQDGYGDGLEVARGSNPTVSSSIPRVAFSVTGQPSNHGTSTPYNYGTHQLALFSTNVFTVPSIVATGEGSRQLNVGWIGTGDVAPSGAGNSVTVTHNTNSALTWRWQQQFLLSETTSLGAPAAFGIFNEQSLLQRTQTNAMFGWRIAAHSNYAIIGAPLESTNNLTSAGAAYIYRLNGTNWTLQARLTAPDNLAYNFFGCTVAIHNDIAVVGGYRGTNNSPACTAYIYRRNGTSWYNEGKVNTGVASENWYTCSVATDGGAVAVAATADSARAPFGGAVYIYRRYSQWQFEAKLSPADGTGYQYFGSSIALSTNRLIVGANGNATNNVTSGAAYIYQRITSWSQVAKLTAPEAAPYAQFGGAVSIVTNIAVVGAPFDEVGGVASGAAYVYRNVTNNGLVQWVREARLTSDASVWNEQFGGTLALQGSNILVTAIGSGSPGNTSIYQRAGTNWMAKAHLRAKTGVAGNGFGFGAALNDSFALVGAPYADIPARDSGLVYSFNWSHAIPSNAISTWWNGNAIAQTSQAAEFIIVSNIVYDFVRWEINGVRQLNSSNEPANPATVVMNQPALASAVYWPRNANTDGDGLPDWWEERYFGNLSRSGSADSDGDGASDFEEMRAGTNPNNASSTFRLSAMAPRAENDMKFSVQWPSASGRSYRIKCSTNLVAGFTVIATNLPATPPMNTFSELPTASSAYYLIEVE